MVIFPYVQYSADMLQTRFGYGSSAGTWYALPYIISGICSPILGFIIDKVGKRALFSKYTFPLVLTVSLFFSYDIIRIPSIGLHYHYIDSCGTAR